MNDIYASTMEPIDKGSTMEFPSHETSIYQAPGNEAPTNGGTSQELPPVKAPSYPKNDPYGCDTPNDLIFTACSTTECTGLIPSLPQSEYERESYGEIYPYMADASRY